MKTPELKPCPFCGGEGKIIDLGFFNLPSSYGVCCLNCSCATYQFFDTEGEAAEAWNRRVSNENA